MVGAVAVGCDYRGCHFGAAYPDAQCIDGLLWDEDSCDEPGGALLHGGEIPCPKCNSAEYSAYHASDEEDSEPDRHSKATEHQDDPAPGPDDQRSLAHSN